MKTTKVGDKVIEMLRKWNSTGGEYFEESIWSVYVGDRGFLCDVWEMYVAEGKKPNVFWDNWASNVIQQLLRDGRFQAAGYLRGRRNLLRVVQLKEEFRWAEPTLSCEKVESGLYSNRPCVKQTVNDIERSE